MSICNNRKGIKELKCHIFSVNFSLHTSITTRDFLMYLEAGYKGVHFTYVNIRDLMATS